MEKEHYFDFAATSPLDEEIAREALELSIEHWGNPSSIHNAGKDARTILEQARERAAKALGVKSSCLYFTSGGTESDHIPLLSILTRPQKGSVLVSSIEHPAIREMSKMLTSCGWQVIKVNSDKNGFITKEAVLEKLQDDTVFVALMAVNNETGAVQEIYKVADALNEIGKNKRKPFFHVDCVQAAGKIPLNLNHKGIDSAAFSAHKICGPRGIGLLYLSKEITPFLRGGGQEKNIRSGTENVFGAWALSRCLEKYYISDSNPEMKDRYNKQIEYTDELMEKLSHLKNCTIIPKIRLDKKACQEQNLSFSPWILQASFRGIPGQVMERALSEKGFYISTGSACSQGHHERPVLDNMDLTKDEKESAVRFSFGVSTSRQAMEELYQAVESVCRDFSQI